MASFETSCWLDLPFPKTNYSEVNGFYSRHVRNSWNRRYVRIFLQWAPQSSYKSLNKGFYFSLGFESCWKEICLFSFTSNIFLYHGLVLKINLFFLFWVCLAGLLQSSPGVNSIYCVDQNPTPYSAPLLLSNSCTRWEALGSNGAIGLSPSALTSFSVQVGLAKATEISCFGWQTDICQSINWNHGRFDLF